MILTRTRRFGGLLGVLGLTLTVAGVVAGPAVADGSNRVTILANSFPPGGMPGTASIQVNTQFVPRNEAPLTGNLSVVVELYSGLNVAAYWNEGAGATAGSCRTAQGANTNLLGSTSYSIPYTAAGITDQRTVTLGGAPRLVPLDDSIYAVTRYIEPADNSVVWSTCAYANKIVVLPTTTTTTIFSPVCPATPPALPGPGMFMPVPFPLCWQFVPMPPIFPMPPTTSDPGWGAGVTSPRQGLWSNTVANCDETATVTVTNPNRRFPYFIRVNGEIKQVAALSSATFVVVAGGDKVVYWSNTVSGPWDPISGNPLTKSIAAGCPTTSQLPTTLETTTTTLAPTTVESTTTQPTTTKPPVTSTIPPVTRPTEPIGGGGLPGDRAIEAQAAVPTTVASRLSGDRAAEIVEATPTTVAAQGETASPVAVVQTVDPSAQAEVQSNDELALTGRSLRWQGQLGIFLLVVGFVLLLTGSGRKTRQAN
jgi:hypothetical protein